MKSLNFGFKDFKSIMVMPATTSCPVRTTNSAWTYPFSCVVEIILDAVVKNGQCFSSVVPRSHNGFMLTIHTNKEPIIFSKVVKLLAKEEENVEGYLLEM